MVLYRTAIRFLMVASAIVPAHAAVNDVFPADYVAQPAGNTSATLYLYDRQLSGPYASGRKTMDGAGDNRVAALRLVHVVDVAGIKVAPMAVLSWGDVDFSPTPLAEALAPKKTGFGDLRVGVSGWLIDEADERHWLGLTAMLSAPTGTYHATQAVNIGENRYRLILGGGWIHPLISKDLLFEAAPEIVWYGRNERYLGDRELKQAPSAALTTYLRYRALPSWHLHAGWQGNWGGATHVDGLDQRNAPGNQRLLAGLTIIGPDSTQLILRLAADTKIENGFRLQREISLRLFKAFR